MNARAPVTVAALILCGGSVMGLVWQARQLGGLRDEGQRLERQLQQLQEHQAVRPESGKMEQPEFSSPSPELLRLRSQASQLGRRERELAGVAAENERLRSQIAAARTNANGRPSLPHGYIRKSEARYLGYVTPEATLESLLWAIQQRDFTNMLAAFTPEIAGKMMQDIGQSGKTIEEFFKGAEALPGMRVVERNVTGSDSIEFKIEVVPGSAEIQPMNFRLINGEWKMNSH